MKELVFEELKRRCEKYDIKEDIHFTAASIADALNMSRNTVSQYLNDKVKNNKVIKINSRPVYFFEKESLEKKMQGRVHSFVYSSFQQLKQEFTDELQDFEKLIGYNNSLSNVVEHCKAAVSYPGGLPILIHGPTGTGKSLIASLMYEFALNQSIIDKDKKFIAVNCSEYANNPELLTTNLFGHVKGAYTGAEEDNPGLISLSDGGILFLDEVHCLKAECQEKLFFFMDKGMYHKVGDNENWYYSKCRLVFATTEDPQNVLLKTLLRRIPITITIPALKDRPLIEKRELIYSILMNESKRLEKNILISNLAYQSLMDFEFIGNVGALKNAIKATCANSFLVHKGKSKLVIQVADLPDYIFPALTSIQLKSTYSQQETMIPIERLKGSSNHAIPLIHLYDQLITRYKEYQKSTSSFPIYMDKTKVLIQGYIDYIMFHNRYQTNTNEAYLLKLLDKIYSIVMNKYSISVANNEIKIYSRILLEYSKCATDAHIWISEHKTTVSALKQELQERLPRIFSIAEEIVENVRLNLDIELDDLLLVMIAIIFAGYKSQEVSSCVGVILCHGYSTASSIAETANRMLEQYLFDGIDMEINISIDKVAQLVDEYLKRKGTIHELIFLVDMGSLEEIYRRIKPLSDYNIGLINNVSTAMALEVGNYIKQGKKVEDILETIKERHTLSTHYLKSKKKQSAILSICATGFGAAKKISELLESSLPRKIDLEIIPYNYQNLVENGNQDSIFQRYQVELIVGTLDPKVNGVPFMAIESVMMNDEIGVLENIIQQYLTPSDLEEFHQNITKNFTLSNIVNHLTILNGEKIIDDVEEIVDYLEEDLDEELDATRKVGLYVHISCLIERLILKQEITYVDGMEEQIALKKNKIEKVKDAFSGVEMRYSVELPEPEALYVLNYFKKT